MNDQAMFVTITVMQDGQIQMQSNAPPGHLLKMLESSKIATIERLCEQERTQNKVLVAPPGLKIR